MSGTNHSIDSSISLAARAKNVARNRWSLVRQHAALIVTLVALTSSIAGLMNDFVYDDVPLIRDNARVHSLSRLWEIVTHPYWPPPFVEQLYRPIPVALFAFEYAIGGGTPLVFRLTSYLLYALNAVLVLLLAKRVLPERAAIGAALLFAAHPVHVEAVALGVNQAELLVAIFGALMAMRYIDTRRAGRTTWSDWLMLCVLYGAALMSKESGFVCALLLVAVEIFLIHGTPLRARVANLWKGYAALLLVALAGIRVRMLVLAGRPLGAIAARLFARMTFSGRMLTMLQVVPTWFRLFVWPLRLRADYALMALAAPSFGIDEFLGLVLLVAAIGAMWSARKKSPSLSFGLAWCAIGLIPVSNIVPTGIVVAERTLFLPSIGAMIALGAGAELAIHYWPVRRVRRVLIFACLLLATLGVARSFAREGAWNSAHVQVVPSPRTTLGN